MVKARNLSCWNMSISMLKGLSPKIHYNCGKCGEYNTTRLSVEAIANRKPYAVCAYCGEVNDTQLKLT